MLIPFEAIDRLCIMGGFTQSWAQHGSQDQTFRMTKIPAVAWEIDIDTHLEYVLSQAQVHTK